MECIQECKRIWSYSTNMRRTASGEKKLFSTLLNVFAAFGYSEDFLFVGGPAYPVVIQGLSVQLVLCENLTTVIIFPWLLLCIGSKMSEIGKEEKLF